MRVRKLSLSEPRTTPSRPYLASSKDPRDDQLEISSLEQVYWATVGERELVEEVLYYISEEAIEVYSVYITYVKTEYWYCWWMDRNARLRHARQGYTFLVRVLRFSPPKMCTPVRSCGRHATRTR